MGGTGKTTLAWAIFNKMSINFDGKSFVENVREKASRYGLEKLQEQVLRNVLKDKNISVHGVHEGKSLMIKKLRGKKVLVVLDDVDHAEQLDALAGDPSWFKPGSRIIITTRDGEVLNSERVNWIHDANLLSNEEAICLFSRHAFGNDIPAHEYERHSREVVRFAAGLPLTIKILGSMFRGKNKPQWRDELARLATVPQEETLKVLELSYESLEDDCKEIFLDVACFLRHWTLDDATRMLESCGLPAKNGLRILEQKYLITLKNDDGSFIQMHDHLVEMGMDIVRREHPKPNKHSRLWVQKEIEHVLDDKSGSEAARYIDLEITRSINLEGLGNMKKLECLIVNNRGSGFDIAEFMKQIILQQYLYRFKYLDFPNSLRYLCWCGYPHRYIPKTFEASNLVALEMPGSKIKQLWKNGKVMEKLKFLNLRYSKLRSLDLGLTPKLERLNLEECKDLVNLNVHGGCLKTLVYLNLSWCTNLKSTCFIQQMESIEILYLHITSFNQREFPDYIMRGHSNNSLVEIRLSFNEDIEEIPSSIGNLHNLVSLDLTYCYRVKSLPGSIRSLRHLTTLNLGFTGIKELPEDLGQLECLEYLDLSHTKVKHLPNSICMLKRLKTLLLIGCRGLEKLPEDVGELESLEELYLQLCSNLREIPSSINKLKHLKVLELYGCERLEKLSDELDHLGWLQSLRLYFPHNSSLLVDLKYKTK